jgi:hypothetical protein
MPNPVVKLKLGFWEMLADLLPAQSCLVNLQREGV